MEKIMATGIKDKVAIIGMGCTRFGERWDMGAEELMVEAFKECLEDAGIEKNDIGAAWLGTCFDSINVGRSALPMSLTLRLPMIPVTRVENYCATGTEAFRGACYAVASGAYDICLALGVEKLKDTGYGGLPSFVGSDSGSLTWQWFPNMTAPGAFAQLASAYAAKYRVSDQDLKRAMAHVSAKSHANGALNSKAHLRKAVTEEQVMAAPIIAHPLGLFDCCGVSDGAACAIVTTPEMAKKLGKKDFITVKALQLALSSGEEMGFNDWDGDHFITTSKCSVPNWSPWKIFIFLKGVRRTETLWMDFTIATVKSHVRWTAVSNVLAIPSGRPGSECFTSFICSFTAGPASVSLKIPDMD
jgi:acetyl-CoA C-acetyltransferase